MALVAVDERGERHRSLPPGDAPDVERADAADQADLRVAQRLAHLGAQVGVDDLGVLVHEHERLEVVALGGPVERRVVAWIEPIAAHVAHESASAARPMPGSAQRRNWSGLVIEQPKRSPAACLARGV